MDENLNKMNIKEPEDFWVSPNELEHIPSFKNEFHQILKKYQFLYNTESLKEQLKQEIDVLLHRYLTDKKDLDVAMNFVVKSECVLKQGDEVVAKFNIEKDSFVKEGEIVYGTLEGGEFAKDASEGDAYLHLVIGTADSNETDVYIATKYMYPTYIPYDDSQLYITTNSKETKKIWEKLLNSD